MLPYFSRVSLDTWNIDAFIKADFMTYIYHFYIYYDSYIIVHHTPTQVKMVSKVSY